MIGMGSGKPAAGLPEALTPRAGGELAAQLAAVTRQRDAYRDIAQDAIDRLAFVRPVDDYTARMAAASQHPGTV